MAPDFVRVAITMPSGHVAVMSFVTREYTPSGEVRWEREPTAGAIESEIGRTIVGPVAGWRLIDEADIPADRYFRNAWKDTGAKLDVDMPKAREIHREHLRARRAPLLAALDTEYMRADEAADVPEKRRIAAKKQALRDVTADPRIDAATTPEALKAVVPAALTGG